MTLIRERNLTIQRILRHVGAVSPEVEFFLLQIISGRVRENPFSYKDTHELYLGPSISSDARNGYLYFIYEFATGQWRITRRFLRDLKNDDDDDEFANDAPIR